ncbi:hypothetical protein GDO81_012376 [Engystomops pustulosus]|uniref:Uncharacterized protein n=1 Tax=Engystomops pustulosus TaxID=76066 RepID=A0AAV7BL23_ENGPU|nr:hypothetical protein GDO81_012376 [Engystomops pustulosus]
MFFPLSYTDPHVSQSPHQPPCFLSTLLTQSPAMSLYSPPSDPHVSHFPPQRPPPCVPLPSTSPPMFNTHPRIDPMFSSHFPHNSPHVHSQLSSQEPPYVFQSPPSPCLPHISPSPFTEPPHVSKSPHDEPPLFPHSSSHRPPYPPSASHRSPHLSHISFSPTSSNRTPIFPTHHPTIPHDFPTLLTQTPIIPTLLTQTPIIPTLLTEPPIFSFPTLLTSPPCFPLFLPSPPPIFSQQSPHTRHTPLFAPSLFTRRNPIFSLPTLLLITRAPHVFPLYLTEPPIVSPAHSPPSGATAMFPPSP